ncbi:hypothetical protein SRABI76_01476 [Microbacterium oxydans]|uniref:hypothetical protein n=1 Tax=Microbacterium oxydans TaxID=82380 RepID=UPI001D8BA4D6|nr:hypothetical protein [Microbacterium oxydans]CAH0178793.1 hypothetical protein SRABI76_01476 [Microbacterium oxydans]
MHLRRLALTVAAAALATSLAACTVAPADGPADSPITASPAPADADPIIEQPSAAPGICTNPAWIRITRMNADISGEIEDQGSRDLAAGTVGVDDDGTIVSYTVAAGDVPAVIGERLCIQNGLDIPTLNHVRTIHPGQVLRLDPNPAVAWVPYHNPADAPGGFQQIPYQQAIEAMGAAADASDIGTMRAIWADSLAGMFTIQADSDVISHALDAGDIDVLRQMFS